MRKQRLTKGDLMNERKLIVDGEEKDGSGEQRRRMKMLSKVCFRGLMCLVLGSWVAYFWALQLGIMIEIRWCERICG